VRSAEAGAPVCARLTDGIAIALDRRASGRVERRAAGVRLESKQALARVEGDRLADLRVPAALAALREVLLAGGFDERVGAVVQARVPADTGLSPDLAATVASAAAGLCLARGGVPAPEDVARLVERAFRDAGEGGGVDPLVLWTALRGGCQRRLGTEVRPVALDPAWIEQSLLLADSGVPARPRAGGCGPSPVDAALETALHAKDGEALPRLIAAGWEAACARDPGVATPEAEAALHLARAAGGAGRPCGPGGGGLLLLWFPPDARAQVVEGLRQAGRRSFPCRVDLLGLDLA
jgi:hypothetical protein